MTLSAADPVAERTLADLDAHVRSKNAGPFWLTIDISCADATAYAELAGSRLARPETIAATFHIDACAVRIFPIPSLRTVKISLPRPTVQGSVNDRDAHAGQQFVALLGTPLG